MNAADTRARCLRRAKLWFVLTWAPAAVVLLLMLAGHWVAASLLFTAGFVTITVGTLMPRCEWFGRLTTRQPHGTMQPLLTIDDGPHPEHTPAILEILDQHGIKAIFFLIGERAAEHPHLVTEILRRGHEIGNHTQTHPAAIFWTLPPERMWDEIARCQETLTQIAPERPPTWFRPPAGHHNMFCVLTAHALGLKTMTWTARGFDGRWKDVDAIVARIRRKLTPGGIVLIHQGTPVAIEVTTRVAALLSEMKAVNA